MRHGLLHSFFGVALLKTTMIVAILLSTTAQAQPGYFNDTSVYLDTMVMIMTHNSLAMPGLVLSPNQNNNLAKQFQDGVRGFNLDLYTNNDDDTNELWTYHGLSASFGYNPTESIQALVTELELPVNREEFVVIQLQDAMSSSTVPSFLELFGNFLITDFDTTLPLSRYINQNQRVLIVSPNDSNVNPAMGMHDTKSYIVENEYEWTTSQCYNGDSTPPLEERYASIVPKQPRPALLMNHFCVNPTFKSGDMVASRAVNRPSRLLASVKRLEESSVVPTTPFATVNIIHVDYYEVGNVFGAQAVLREKDNGGGTDLEECWPDHTACGDATCWHCCSVDSYWVAAQSETRCGTEPLEEDKEEDNDTGGSGNDKTDIPDTVPCWPTGQQCTAGIFGSSCQKNCCSGGWQFQWSGFTYRCT